MLKGNGRESVEQISVLKSKYYLRHKARKCVPFAVFLDGLLRQLADINTKDFLVLGLGVVEVEKKSFFFV